MKNNNHGFIAMSIIYSIFIFFIMGLVSIMFIYISDRKTSSRVKDDIKNQFNANAPHVLLSMEGSNQSQDSYSVTISVQEDKYSIASLNYAWTNSKETTEPNIPFTANSTINSPLTRGNWYLHVKVCDTYGNCSYVVSDKFKVGSPVCKRATTLHTETCNQSRTDFYCRADGYDQGGTITYGNLGKYGLLKTGDAFDCDVNGDGVYDSETERFYYIKDVNRDTALMSFYSTVTGGLPNTTTHWGYSLDYSSSQYYGPINAVLQLPTTSQWSNISLMNETVDIKDENGTVRVSGFSYVGRAARLLTVEEINSGCGITVGNSVQGELSIKCKFLMEGSNYSDENSSGTNIWLDAPSSTNAYNAWFVTGAGRSVGNNLVTSSYSVRPVIEVSKEAMDI